MDTRTDLFLLDASLFYYLDKTVSDAGYYPFLYTLFNSGLTNEQIQSNIKAYIDSIKPLKPIKINTNEPSWDSPDYSGNQIYIYRKEIQPSGFARNGNDVYKFADIAKETQYLNSKFVNVVYELRTISDSRKYKDAILEIVINFLNLTSFLGTGVIKILNKDLQEIDKAFIRHSGAVDVAHYKNQFESVYTFTVENIFIQNFDTKDRTLLKTFIPNINI